MKTIKIKASELSKLTGHNTYETIESTIQKILNDNNIKNVYIPKSNVESQLISLPEKSIIDLKKSLKLPDNASVIDVERNIKNNIKQSYRKDISEPESKKNVDDILKKIPELKSFDDSIKKDLMVRRGNIKENDNLNLTESKYNIKIDQRNSKLYQKILFIDLENNYQILLKGKIDGYSIINGEKHIIETKNRTRRLFNQIPDYEKVQLESYMFLKECEYALHIENYNNTSNEVYYNHDQIFWDDCIQKVKLFMVKHILPEVKIQ